MWNGVLASCPLGPVTANGQCCPQNPSNKISGQCLYPFKAMTDGKTLGNIYGFTDNSNKINKLIIVKQYSTVAWP